MLPLAARLITGYVLFHRYFLLYYALCTSILTALIEARTIQVYLNKLCQKDNHLFTLARVETISISPQREFHQKQPSTSNFCEVTTMDFLEISCFWTLGWTKIGHLSSHLGLNYDSVIINGWLHMLYIDGVMY